MKTIIIVAMTPDRLIGANGAIPWHEPADLRHFKRTTTGHAVIMGRKTHDSIGRPLPNRRNIVVTRNHDYAPPDDAEKSKRPIVEKSKLGRIHEEASGGGERCRLVTVVHSLDEALDLCRRRGERLAFVIGGAEVYRAALPLADEMIVTHVDRVDLSGDTHFPPWCDDDWRGEPVETDTSLRITRYTRVPRRHAAPVPNRTL